MQSLLLLAVTAMTIGADDAPSARWGMVGRVEALGKMLKGRVLVYSVKVGMTDDEVTEILGRHCLTSCSLGLVDSYWPDYGITVFTMYPTRVDADGKVLCEPRVTEVRYHFSWPESHR
jgi:hypothetical protein